MRPSTADGDDYRRESEKFILSDGFLVFAATNDIEGRAEWVSRGVDFRLSDTHRTIGQSDHPASLTRS